MKRIHLIISGDVQGVGYRSWARRSALKRGLTGWVKNRPDRTVELVAEGKQQSLEDFIEECRKGPEVAWVERIDSTWKPATGEYVAFQVVY